MSWLEDSHLNIPFQEIELATNNFKTKIGKGGFGEVYEGQISLSDGHVKVAVKQLDSKLTGQGLKEFLTEIQLLSGYKHPNLISLLGFCQEGDEKILVYEYAEHRSLDRYLNIGNTQHNLTWIQRLRICVGAARGIDYLHSKVGEHHRVIHRDIKSANILLDHNWEAKISDLGLSKLGIANENNSFLVSNACGTQGYCDPAYMSTGILTKESDVYSFGVVLLEVLCGRLCIINTHDERRFLVPLARSHIENKKLDEIIHPDLRKQMDSNSLNTFSTVAYQCVLLDRGKRPSMSLVVEELEEALEFQGRYEFEKEKELKDLLVSEADSEAYWEQRLPRDYEETIKALDTRVVYTSKKELFSLLHEGILFDKRKRLFSIDGDGEKCEMIAAAGFLDPNLKSYGWEFRRDLRFSMVAEFPKEELNIRCQMKTKMLSSGIMYAASLVFKFRHQPNEDIDSPKYVGIKWKYEDLSVSSTHLAEWTEDGWLKLEMWHFMNYKKNAEFEITLGKISDTEGFDTSGILILGIQFQPIQKKLFEEIEGSEDQTQMDSLLISDGDVNWEHKLPSDYEDIIQTSNEQLDYKTKKELYFLLCRGILIDSGKLWFSLCKLTGKKFHMQPAREILRNDPDYKILKWISLPKTRFGEGAQLHDAYWFLYTCKLRPHMFSPEDVYKCYLVFKFQNDYHGPDDDFMLQAEYQLEGKHHGNTFTHLKILDPINVPVIKPKNDKRSINTLNIPKVKGLHGLNSRHSWMEMREDGWMEVALCKSINGLAYRDSYNLTVKLHHQRTDVFGNSHSMNMSDIIVQGIEFRPM